MMQQEDTKQKWDEIYAKQKSGSIQAAYVVNQFAHLLPNKGVALDIASGLGGNAIYFARHGLISHAWDISSQAIENLNQYCAENNISMNTEIRDVVAHPPEKNSFDVISVSFFLERTISSKIIAALKPNGLLFYQTFVLEKVSTNGPSNPDYRLQQNELLKMFTDLHILAYQEEGCVGDQSQGLRDVALLVAQKR